MFKIRLCKIPRKIVVGVARIVVLGCLLVQPIQAEEATSVASDTVVNSGYKEIDSHYWDDKSHTDSTIYDSGRGVSSATIVLMLVSFGILIILTREPNPTGLKVILHLTRADMYAKQEKLRAGKRLLVGIDRASTVAFLYGLYETPHYLILPVFMGLLDKGIYKSVQDEEDGEIYFVRKYPYVELSDIEKGLCDILEGNARYLELEDVLNMRGEKLKKWEESYLEQELRKMVREDYCTTPNLFQKILHKVSVYRSYDKMRDTLRDIRRLGIYFKQYDLDSCEESTREEDMGKLVLIGLLTSELTGVGKSSIGTQKKVRELTVLKDQLDVLSGIYSE